MERLSSSSSSLRPASALLAVLLLASAAAEATSTTAPSGGQNPTKCGLSGTWVNDLGSRMVISALNDAGGFSGSYLTAVTSANEAITKSPLLGVQQPPDQRGQPTFGFLVQWTFTASTTAFVGQCFVDEAGGETLETTWLLRKEAATHDQDWQSTLVGKNVFRRIK